MSRLHELIRSTPPTTGGCISLCITLFILQVILDFPISSVTLCPRLVIFHHEYYRIITSSLFHGGLLHLGMNMMSTLTIATWLEGQLGTIRLLISILWSIGLTSILYIIVAAFLYYSFGWVDLMNQHSVGFSAVIFHLSVLESHLGTHSSRSVFGIFEVPARVYPWALLVIMQLIMPNLSFTGHLCGILIGTLQLHGLLSYLFPKESRLLEFETWTSITWLTSMPSFVPTTHEPTTGNYSLLRQHVCLTLQVLKSRALTALEGLKVYIFGRGVTANANTRFAPTEIGDEREYLPLSSPENSELV